MRTSKSRGLSGPPHRSDDLIVTTGRTGPSGLGKLAALIALPLVAVTAAFSVPEGAHALPLWLVAVSGLPFLTMAMPGCGPFWARFGSTYAAGWLAILLAGTGGAQSPYVNLYVVLVILSSIGHSPRQLAVVGLLTVLGMLSPVAYDPAAGWAYVHAIVFDVMLAFLVAFAIRRLVQRLVASEQRTQASEEQFRSLAQNASDVIYRYRLRPEPAVEFLNDVAETISGFPPERFLAQPSLIWDRMHPEDRERHRTLRRDRDRIAEPVTIRWQRADGEWIWLEERLTPLHDDEGRIEAVHGIVRDISRQKHAEERLVAALDRERAAADRLRAFDELKNAFLQAVSHELRTPITSLVGYARTLQRHDAALTDGQRTFMLDRLVVNAGRLEGLLTDLLDVDRLSHGQVTLDRSRSDVEALVRQVVAEQEADDRLIRLHLEPLIAPVDAPKFGRIVSNLVRNACKHTPAGTPIDIRLSSLDGAVHLAVEDAGPGVPDELKDAIFEPFRQGPSSSHDASPGTGIGLSLVRRLADLHGGRAWVDDRPGGGARFHVLLPAERHDGDEPAEDPANVARRA